VIDAVALRFGYTYAHVGDLTRTQVYLMLRGGKEQSGGVEVMPGGLADAVQERRRLFYGGTGGD